MKKPEHTTTIRLMDVTLTDDAITLSVQRSDGAHEALKLPMADFILLRLRLDQLAKPPKDQSTPLGPRQLQVIHPQQLGVLQEALAGDPVLIARLGQLGELALQIPKTKLPGLMQALLPFLSQDDTGQAPS